MSKVARWGATVVMFIGNGIRWSSASTRSAAEDSDETGDSGGAEGDEGTELFLHRHLAAELRPRPGSFRKLKNVKRSGDAPGLFGVLDQVAARIGAKPVQAVVIDALRASQQGRDLAVRPGGSSDPRRARRDYARIAALIDRVCAG